MSAKTWSRRDFLKAGAAGLTVIVAGRQLVRPDAPAADESTASPPARPRRWAMVIDQSKCIGCRRCVLACQAYNDCPPDITWTRLEEAGEIGGRDLFLPVPCQQCARPPCVDVCPVKANHVRPDGIVTIDYDRCIGCRYCQIACPYDARHFNWESFDGANPAVPAYGLPEVARRPRGVVEKCSFCHQRIDRGLAAGLTPGVDPMATPVCVGACPTGARQFGDLNDPDSPVSRLLARHPSFRLRDDLGTEPRVYYLPPEADDEEV